MREELTILDIFHIVWSRKKLLLWLLILFTGGSIAYSLLATEIFKAECRILPSKQNSGMAAQIMAQMGGLGDLAGLAGISTSGQLLVGILKGDMVLNAIIDRFNLMALYEKDTKLKMREMIISNLLDATEDTRSGIVTVSVLDEDPARAAEMANAFVEELSKRLQSLSIGEATQRRIFFEGQVNQAFKALGEAEDEMARYQEQSGLVAVGPQLEALFTSIAQLRAQIAAKEVEISGLRTYAKQDNLNLRLAQSQLETMRTELVKLEEQQKKQGQSNLEGNGESFSSMSQVPQFGLEYQRRLRDVKFAEAIYELMLKQFEAAKLDEAKDLLTVHIVDPATPPDYKFKPKRALIVLFSTALGLCLGIFWALFENYIKILKTMKEGNDNTPSV